MQATALFIAYLALALICGAFLAYPLALAGPPMIDEPLHSLITLSAKLVALCGAVLFLGCLGLNSKQALGYAFTCRQFTTGVLAGLPVGVAIMLPVIGILIALRVRVFDPEWVFSWSELAVTVLQALLTGVLVALIEETFFRGAMFAAVARDSGLWPAAVLTSLLYAALHFIDTDYDIPANQLEWHSGLVVLAHMFEEFADPALIADSFLALLAAGLLLALVRARTGHIAMCIGLHAGWVLAIKVTKDLTSIDESAEFSFLVGTYDDVTGYLALGLLTILIAIYYMVAIRGKVAAQQVLRGARLGHR